MSLTELSKFLEEDFYMHNSSRPVDSLKALATNTNQRTSRQTARLKSIILTSCNTRHITRVNIIIIIIVIIITVAVNGESVVCIFFITRCISFVQLQTQRQREMQQQNKDTSSERNRQKTTKQMHHVQPARCSETLKNPHIQRHKPTHTEA